MNAAGAGGIVLDTLSRDTERRLVVQRRIRASVEDLFRACTDPARLREWWGPPGFTQPVYEIDLRPGGAVYFAMTGPDGLTYGMTGEVRQVTSPYTLVFTSEALTPEGAVALETETRFDFEPDADGTRVTTSHRVAAVHESGRGYLAGMPGAWLEKLDRLAAYADTQGSATIEIVLSRTINASRSLVFEAWTRPEHFARWFAPHEGTVTDISLDVRPGGRLRFCHRMPSLGEPVWVTGEYEAVEPPRRLVYRESFADPEGNAIERPGFARESRVEVIFEESDGATELTLRHSGLIADRGEREGWTEMLERLAILLQHH